MKNTLKYSALALLCLTTAFLTGCRQEELDTDQFGGSVALSAVAPNPVMRGGVLRILGANLENVTEVRFAGDITVTDIEVTKAGVPGELRVTVPLEGPEVGKVSIVTKDGTVLSSFSDLSFTEPIELDSFSPAEVLSGDVITVKGEYLNNVQEVILGGEAYVTEFISQSRHELKFTVPGHATTGFVIVGDVNELVDPNTIPNQIYSQAELVVGDPTVRTAQKATYKRGDVITVTGSHLDMVRTVNLNGASDVDFTVAEDGLSLTFTLPGGATDGEITLVSYAGKSFSAGEIETVTVADLGIVSKAEDGRYKAGCQVEISGSDLDLVSKVEFVNAEASWYQDGGKIIATLPAAAKDGSVTVTLESGKQAWTPEIAVVKPVVGSLSATTAVAGKDRLTVSGEDLDLVTDVKIGDKVQSFIPCEFSLEGGALVVSVPADAYTGVITVTAANGYESTTETVEITYDEVISVVFDAPSFALGKNISFTGTNLLQVESVSIKGNKVTQYLAREDGAMSFLIPDGVGPGVYRLNFTLLDGTEIAWPVPFEITAAYTETMIWEGSAQTGNYTNNLELGGEDDWVNAEIAVGDVVRVYFTPDDPSDWSMQLFTGHWAGMSMLFPDLPDPNQFNQDRNPDAVDQGYVAFEVTEEIYNLFTEKAWWGSALIVQGKNLTVTGISLIKFSASETVVWEGPSGHTGDYAANQELGGEDDWVNNDLFEGAEVRIYFTPDDWSDWSIQVFDGHWGSLSYVTPDGIQWNNENTPEAAEKGYVSFKAEGSVFTALTSKQWWGSAIILQGKNLVFTKVTFI